MFQGLQIEFNRPISGPYSFTKETVPVFQLGLPTQLQEIVPHVTARLLEKVQEAAPMNAGRMAAFNLLISNNFNNEYLPRWVDFATRLSAILASEANQPMMALAHVGEAVIKTALFLASLLITTVPEIYNSCSTQAQQGAFVNSESYRLTAEKTQNMNYQNYQSPMHTNYGQPVPVQQQMPQTFQNNPAPAQSTWGQTQQASQQQTPTSTWGQATKPNNVLSQAAYFQTPPEGWGQGSNQKNTWSQQPAQETKQQPHPTTTPVPVIFKTVTINGENEMDIKNHSVPYFGSKELFVDLSARKSDLRMDAIQITKEGRTSPKGSEPILLERSHVSATNLEEAILTSRCLFDAYRGQQQNTLFRQFLTILNPIPIVAAAEPAMEVFTANSGVEQLPQKFRNFLKAINVNNPTQEEQDALNFYVFMDRKLAQSVNNFLSYNLRLPNIRINNFSADLVDLVSYLDAHVGGGAESAFYMWYDSFIDSLRLNYNSENKSFLRNYYSLDDNVTFGYYPENISLTLTSLTSSELNYDCTTEGTLIDNKSTQVLGDIADSLNRNKKDLNVFTHYDWFITSDDARYRFGTDFRDMGKTYLHKPL